MRSKTRMLLLSILACTTSSLAMADGSVNVKSETVRYDDLRLISNVGASVLYARLRKAAEHVCGSPIDAAQLPQQRGFRACVDDALAKAVVDVNHPVLTQYAAIRRNSSAPSTPGITTVTAVAKAP